jgi:hypothetical protein
MEKIKCNVSVEEPNNSRRFSKSSATLLPHPIQESGCKISRQIDKSGMLIKQW